MIDHQDVSPLLHDEAGGIPESNLMISDFTTADNGAVIFCSDVMQ